MSPLRKPSFLSRRKTWFSPAIDKPETNPNYADDDRYEVNDYDFANLVSSEMEPGSYEMHRVGETYHLPVLDIDFDAHLEPSTTEGHYHLYLNKKVSWDQYKRLLDVMGDIGLLEAGFVKLSKERGATFARKPGTKKFKKLS